MDFTDLENNNIKYYYYVNFFESSTQKFGFIRFHIVFLFDSIQIKLKI